MNIQPILAQYSQCKYYSLEKEVSGYLKYIDGEPPFYISPEFTPVKLDTVSSMRNPKFILFSAAGAAGKSALAEYISNRFHALYWNLSQLKIGENSFGGTLIKALKAENYSSFILDLNKGNVLLAIDAFDEAEMISGRSMISNFLSDISNVINGQTKPPIFLFARTESAQFITSYCIENNIQIR